MFTEASLHRVPQRFRESLQDSDFRGRGGNLSFEVWIPAAFSRDFWRGIESSDAFQVFIGFHFCAWAEPRDFHTNHRFGNISFCFLLRLMLSCLLTFPFLSLSFFPTSVWRNFSKKNRKMVRWKWHQSQFPRQSTVVIR